jgi:hypothetical protein
MRASSLIPPANRIHQARTPSLIVCAHKRELRLLVVRGRDRSAESSGPGRSATAVLTLGTALNGIELCQVVDVLGAELIAGAELALLLRRQAVHPPPGDGPRGKRTRRIIKISSVQARLTAAPVLREPHRMDINPATACCSQFDPDGQPVCFGHITQIAENRETSRQILRVHREIKIAVFPGLPARQRHHAPAPADPATHPSPVQRIHGSNHILSAHAPRLQAHHATDEGPAAMRAGPGSGGKEATKREDRPRGRFPAGNMADRPVTHRSPGGGGRSASLLPPEVTGGAAPARAPVQGALPCREGTGQVAKRC